MSKLILVIGNKNYSSWSLRPWIFLRHHQIGFEEKWIPLFTDTTAGELAEYDPDYKVPILKDGELIVWGSLSILEYVSEVYIGNNGWLARREARSVARSISSEMHSSYTSLRHVMTVPNYFILYVLCCVGASVNDGDAFM